MLLVTLLLLGGAAEAGDVKPKLVRDIEQSTVGCSTSEIVPGPDAFYFGTSFRCRGGLALWRTDGTVVGTYPVRTFDGGARGFTLVQPLAELDGTLLFGLGTLEAAGAPVVELWRSDGTEGGTELVRTFGARERVAHGRLDRPPVHVVVDGRLLFFVEDELSLAATPWITDGTAEGTRAIAGLAGPMSVPTQILVHDGEVYLVAWHEGSSALLHVDRAFGGVTLLSFIGDPGSADAAVDPAVAPGPDGAVWFQTTVAPSVRELWRTEGTPATTSRVLTLPFRAVWALAGDVHYVLEQRRGTARISRLDPASGTLTLLHDFAPPPLGTNDFRVGARDRGLLYFGYDHNWGFPKELWRSDGTVAGTFRIHDGYPPAGFVPVGDGLGFAPATEDAYALWHTDGTIAGTLALGSGPARGFEQFRALGDGSTLFVARRGTHDDLHRTDATAAGTTLLQELPWEISTLAARAGIGVLFNRGTLWRTDGTADGTFPLLEIGPWTAGSFPSALTDVAGTLLFFTGGPDDPVVELWRSDGRRSGTTRVLEWQKDDRPRLPIAAGARLYFVEGASTLWSSDGTSGGTSAIADLGEGDPRQRIVQLEALGDVAYATVLGSRWTQGALWRSEGTEATTTLVAALPARSLVAWDGALYFAAVPSPKVDGVYRSDGTPGGTRPLVKLRAAEDGRRPYVGRVLPGEDGLWFSVGTPGRTELWRSDGTRGGTSSVDVVPVAVNDRVGAINDGTELAGNLVFSFALDSTVTSTNLWRSSGAPGGIKPVAAIYPFIDLGGFTRVGDRVVFKSPSDEIAGVLFWPQDLWSTDGTEGGTAQILPGASILGQPVLVGDTLYLCARAYADDRYRLWRSDGTPEGTVPLFDREMDCGGSMAPVGDLLFFSGATARFGAELWTVPLDPP